MKFPKPEKGVDRYEVYYQAAESSYWAFDDGFRTLKAARAQLKMYADGTAGGSWPAYIYDRRTGKVSETNEEVLKKVGASV